MNAVYLLSVMFHFVAQSFKLIAQTIGECMVSRPDVRMDVLSALRKVLLHSMAGE